VLRSLSLFLFLSLSLSLSVSTAVSLHPARITIRKHTHGETRGVKMRRVHAGSVHTCVRFLHFSTHKHRYVCARFARSETYLPKKNFPRRIIRAISAGPSICRWDRGDARPSVLAFASSKRCRTDRAGSHARSRERRRTGEATDGFSTWRTPLTAHRSPLTAHRSPLTAHRVLHSRFLCLTYLRCVLSLLPSPLLPRPASSLLSSCVRESPAEPALSPDKLDNRANDGLSERDRPVFERHSSRYKFLDPFLDLVRNRVAIYLCEIMNRDSRLNESFAESLSNDNDLVNNVNL